MKTDFVTLSINERPSLSCMHLKMRSDLPWVEEWAWKVEKLQIFNLL